MGDETCDGLAAIDDSSVGKWCGPPGSWVGRWTDTGADLRCVAIEGTFASSNLTLSYDDGGAWTPVPVQVAFSDAAGQPRAELTAGCDACMWIVTSEDPWSVSQLQMFTDTVCETQLQGHVIANTFGCDGISAAQAGTEGRWCGGVGSWLCHATLRAV